LTHADYTTLGAALLHRPRLGMNPNSYGLYFTVAFIGLMLYAPRILKETSSRLGFWGRGFFWAGALMLVSFGLVISKSRSAFLGLGVAGLIVVVLARKEWRGAIHLAVPRKPMLAWGVGLLAVVLIVGGQWQLIRGKIYKEAGTIHSLLEGAEVTDNNSVSARVYLWQLGINSILARPFFGWGPGGPRHLLDRDPSIHVREGNLPDFHNSYIQILLELGIVGGLLWILLLGLLTNACLAARRYNWIPADLYLLLVGGALAFMVATAFNLRTGDFYGREFVALWGAMAYAFSLRKIWPQTADHMVQGAPRV
jgi:O-antigen ligase